MPPENSDLREAERTARVLRLQDSGVYAGVSKEEIKLTGGHLLNVATIP